MTLSEKLFKIQNLKLKFGKDGSSHYGKYLTLDRLWEVLQPELEERKLLVTHYTEDSKIVTRVTDIEESDKHVDSKTPLPENLEPQKLGSAITYFKRYNLSMIFNIIADEDDDAQSTVKAPVKTEPAGSKVCDMCGEVALVSPKSGRDFCPNWKIHKEKDERYSIINRGDKEFTDSLPEIN